jgi:hypothetical protein
MHFYYKGHNIMQKFIINKEEYLKAKAAWNNIPNRTATDHIFYNALRGHDLKRGFAETISERKLTNGKGPWDSYNSALSSAAWSIRIEPKYSHDTPERAARREAATKEHIDGLGKKYGTEFTPELLTALREVFKGEAA